MSEDKLLEAYSGKKAQDYDARRSRSTRWRNEVAAMEGFLSRLSPRMIVDCPFGTGRWIPQYAKTGAAVVGVDLSESMLREAEVKLAGAEDGVSDRVRLVEGSIFDLSPEMVQARPDLVVCVRFLNWVPRDDALRALDRLTGLGASDMIVGVSLVPESATGPRRAVFRGCLAMTNWRHRDGRSQYVHDEGDILRAFESLGWRVEERVEIMRRLSRVNYFYRLGQSRPS